MEKEGKSSKQFVACSIFNSFSAWHKDGCQTTGKRNRGWQRGMKKKKKERALRWEWRRPRGNFPFKEVCGTHTHTHGYNPVSAARTSTHSGGMRPVTWGTRTCRCAHAPRLFLSSDLRKGRRELGRNSEWKSPDSSQLWDLQTNFRHHGDAANRRKHSAGWPAACCLPVAACYPGLLA